MAAPLAHHVLKARAERFQLILRHEGQRRSGKAAAVDAAGSVAVQKLFRQRQRERHLLMLLRAQRRDVLQIELRRTPRLGHILQKRLEIVVPERPDLKPDAPVFLKEVDGAQDGAVAAFFACLRDPVVKRRLVHLAQTVLSEHRRNGRGFQYPIPTYSITKDFDWSPTENNKLLFEMTAKYGTPYFSNYINSDMEPSDVRSMCCRLRLDLRELRKKSGGYFGSGESTGSVGVVTINLPRIAYLSQTPEEFYERLDHMMDIAARSLKV